MSFRSTRVRKASEAKIWSLWAESIPSMSSVGSASAYPASWASRSASSKSRPSSVILVRMKFEVPLTMPWSDRIRFAARPSRSAPMIGTPPATAASKPRNTPRRRAVAKSSVPCVARSALFAVTTCLPASSARRTYVRAGSRPADHLDHDQGHRRVAQDAFRGRR